MPLEMINALTDVFVHDSLFQEPECRIGKMPTLRISESGLEDRPAYSTHFDDDWHPEGHDLICSLKEWRGVDAIHMHAQPQ